MVCINVEPKHMGGNVKFLTKDKIYDVEPASFGNDYDTICLVTINGEKMPFSKHRFKTLVDVREEKLLVILNAKK